MNMKCSHRSKSSFAAEAEIAEAIARAKGWIEIFDMVIEVLEGAASRKRRGCPYPAEVLAFLLHRANYTYQSGKHILPNLERLKEEMSACPI